MEIQRTTLLSVNESTEGESIETKVERITTQNEPLQDECEMIYTNRSDGVLPEYDPRTDRFEVAIEYMDKFNKTKINQRMERIKERDGKPESIAEGKPTTTEQ